MLLPSQVRETPLLKRYVCVCPCATQLCAAPRGSCSCCRSAIILGCLELLLSLGCFLTTHMAHLPPGSCDPGLEPCTCWPCFTIKKLKDVQLVSAQSLSSFFTSLALLPWLCPLLPTLSGAADNPRRDCVHVKGNREGRALRQG